MSGLPVNNFAQIITISDFSQWETPTTTDLPWIAPSRFYDMYPDASEIPGPTHPLPPIGMPDVAWKPAFGTTPDEPLPLKQTKLMRRALYATMSYVDELFGKVLDELEALSLSNSTVVSFMGDHGQHVSATSSNLTLWLILCLLLLLFFVAPSLRLASTICG